VVNTKHAMAKEQDPDDDVSAELTALEDREKSLEAYARRQGFEPPRHWRPDDHTKDMAIKHGRRDEYVDILILHQFVHGSMLAMDQRYTVENGLARVGGDAADIDGWIAIAGLVAAKAAVDATAAICRIVDLPEPDALRELSAEVEAHRELL
jgi:hypothetical protein